MAKKWTLTLSLAAALILSLVIPLQASTQRVGMSFGIGVGAMVASNNEAYMSLGNDLYPEFQFIADAAFFRAGITAGAVYRKLERTWWGYGGSGYNEFTMLYMPVMADFSFLPLRIAAPNLLFQVYVGGCAGIYKGLADVSNETYVCGGPKFGIEFYFGEFFVLDIEGRYVAIPEELGYFNALVNCRFRIPLVRRVYEP